MSNYEYPHELMTVNSFVSTFGYNIDKLYIDKFWGSIDNNDWIIIDYDMLKWIGYTYVRDRDNKRKYLDLLINNFNRHIDYDELSRIAVSNRVPKGALNNLAPNTVSHPRFSPLHNSIYAISISTSHHFSFILFMPFQSFA